MHTSLLFRGTAQVVVFSLSTLTLKFIFKLTSLKTSQPDISVSSTVNLVQSLVWVLVAVQSHWHCLSHAPETPRPKKRASSLESNQLQHGDAKISQGCVAGASLSETTRDITISSTISQR